MEFDPVKKPLTQLLGQMDKTELVLPEFQRSFVWKPAQIVELLRSVCRSYPSGSLLFLRYKKDVMAVRPVESADHHGNQPFSIILDGQQRLTALYHALYGKSEFRYFLDLSRLEKEDFDGAIQVYRFSEVSRRKLDDENTQYQTRTLPAPRIVEGLDKWKWGFSTYRKEKENVDFPDSGKWFENIQQRFIEPILRYQFPVVELPENTQLTVVSEIFEILNRTGTKLTLFDLMTAKLWPSRIKLRELWKEAKEKYKTQMHFLEDPTQLLQTIALLRFGQGQKEDILKLDAEGFEQEWSKSVDGLRKAIGLLKGECGVLTPKWLPYSSMLPPMAAVVSLIEELPPKDQGEPRQKLILWFWCASLGERYERSTGTQAARDYQQLEKWFEGGPEPESVKDFVFPESALYEASKQGGAVYRSVICLTVSNGARDFAKGSKISTLDLLDEEIDDHHVFPRGYLKSKQQPKQFADCVLNRALIDASTNRGVIGSKAPSKYLAQLGENLKSGGLVDILRSQLLVKDNSSDLFKDEFSGFLEQRSKILCDQIKKVTGGSIAESVSFVTTGPAFPVEAHASISNMQLPAKTTAWVSGGYFVPSASGGVHTDPVPVERERTIADLVEEAIQEAGGTADLAEIYKYVRRKRPKTARHVIRATVNLNIVGGRARTDRFARKGRGAYGMADKPGHRIDSHLTRPVPELVVGHGEKGLDQVLAVASLMKKGFSWNKACHEVASERGTKHNTVMAATTRRLNLDGKRDFEEHLKNGTLAALLIAKFPIAKTKIESFFGTMNQKDPESVR